MRPALFASKAFALPVLALLALLSVGCGHVPRMLGGSGDATLRLDGEQQHETSLPAGHTLTLDMRDPGASGYVFSGTSFDTRLLRLDSIEPVDGGGRILYRFTALTQGESDVVIKIRKPEPGYRPDVFKRIRVSVTQ